MRADLLHVFALLAVCAEKYGGEQFVVGIFEIGVLARVFRHFFRRDFIDGGLVQRLYGKFAGAAARGFFRFFGF